MIDAIVGFGGSGKTALAVMMIYDKYYKNIYYDENDKCYYSKYSIITNVSSLKIPHLDLDSQFIPLLKKIREEGYVKNNIHKRLLFVDEIQKYLDSRSAMTYRNKQLTQEFFQIRKYRMEMIYTLQDYMSLDARLRRITEYIYLPKIYEDSNIMYVEITNNQLIYINSFYIRFNPKIFEFYDTMEWISGDIDMPDRIKGTNLILD